MSWLGVGERNVTSEGSESSGTARRTRGWGDGQGEAPPAPLGGGKIGWGQHLPIIPKSWSGSCYHHQGTNARGDTALSSWALGSGSTEAPVSCRPAKLKG